MKTIPLTKGYAAVVDDCDFEELNIFKWCALERRKRYGVRVYAVRRDRTPGKNRKVYMHRVVAERAGMSAVIVDHKDNDSLNNKRDNLRVCTVSENCRNKSKNSNNKSGFKGVSWHAGAKRWIAQICRDYKRINIGYFDNPEEAHAAYCEAAERLHGEFARTQ